MKSVVRIATGIFIGLLAVWMISEPAFAQCAMCRGSLGSNSSFIRNFNLGVLVLLVPPVTIFCTIFIVAYRHRKS
jgi:hypothetical protein